MDPDANLARQVELANAINGTITTWRRAEMAEELAELVLAMNEWLSTGGFPPERWRQHTGEEAA